MANLIMILGESGTGKSTSIENLDPKETFIFQIVDKPLPFRNFKSKYSIYSSKENPEGNRVVSDDTEKIIKMMDILNKKDNVKVIIIDDSQYIMANEFIRRAKEKGYEKFTEITQHFFNVIDKAAELREDITVVFLHHIEFKDDGRAKAKTVGKMMDDKIGTEGRFSIVLVTEIEDGNYYFRTQNNGFDTCKSPKGMFEELRIPNDLEFIIKKVNEYFN